MKPRSGITPPEGFHWRHSQPCEDCLIRDDLDLLGRVRKGSYGRVRTCAGCDGKGWTTPQRILDPMWTGRGV